MSQNLLLAIGVGVFAITVCATLLYGYFTFNRIYQEAVAEELALRQLAERSAPEPALAESVSVAATGRREAPVPG